ncbi:MAG: hypothetical protein LBC53_03420 [Spirochaetaceae bacterium]|jgi:hypothetical protein|nr:hypothetical protein [Spirochaetaceae bacterium]
MASFGFAFGQNNRNNNDSVNVYTFFVNVVNERFLPPLLGFVNIAHGNHYLPQIGFINWNTSDFNTLQLGFVNTIGKNLNGAQIGFVNTVAGGNSNGLQLGFINTTVKNLSGAQIGFINTVANGKSNGLQLGFINTTVRNFNGAQIGFINTAVDGNSSGIQLGFINYVDSIENGVPIGFLSFVKNGGYKAIQLSAGEIAPVSFSFRTGIRKFYTSLGVSYNPFNDGIDNQIFFSFGIGSIIDINEKFFINPEIESYNSLNEYSRLYISFTPNIGYNIKENIAVLAGPSVSWDRGTNEKNSFINLLEYKLNADNSLIFGARIALRFQF